MKRIIPCLSAIVLILSLAACRGLVDKAPDTNTLSSETPKPRESVENTESADTKTEQQSSNILIAYFSLGRNAEYPDDIDASASASLVLDEKELVGTTEYVARLIQDYVGGDLHSIQTAKPYPTDFDSVVDQNHEEMDDGTLPELVSSDLDVSGYDTVFIGYPVWATNAPQAIFSFLSQYDMSGKTIIPFCTHDGYGAGDSYGDIADAIDGETAVMDGIAIEAPDVPDSASTVAEWLSEIGVETQQSGTGQAQDIPN